VVFEMGQIGGVAIKLLNWQVLNNRNGFYFHNDASFLVVTAVPSILFLSITVFYNAYI